MSLLAELPEVREADASAVAIYAKDRDGCASFDVPGFGFVARHHEGGWMAFSLAGRVVARGLSYRREAVEALVVTA